MKKITVLIILCFVFPAHNTIQTAAHNIFVLDTKDLNNNGINDVLAFSGKNIVKKVTIYDVKTKGLNKIWEYNMPEHFTGFFTDAVFADLNGNGSNELVLIASLENSSNIFFLFETENNNINNEPIKISQLPGNYSKIRNPKKAIVLDWDSDKDMEFGLSFTSPDRKVLICDYENREFLILEEIGNDFLPNTYGPIMISAGDLNGDKKDDMVIIDNGAQAKARIYINGSHKEGVRILGLKDVGHLSYLSPIAVDLDENGGEEIFCSSTKTGLHYIFVETIGTTNQAVTVKTELLVKSVNQMFFGKTNMGKQIITTHPDGTIGRYEIKQIEGDLATGIFETTQTKYSFNTPDKISGIYFPKERELIVSAEKDNKSEIFFYSHKSYIEPTIDFSSQRTDKRTPEIILPANSTENIPLLWVDTLSFINFKSNNLSDGMGFSEDGKMIQWTPTLNQLGFHDIIYTGRFRYQGEMKILQEDSTQTIQLEENIITLTDTLLIYVNDPPSLEENKNDFLTVSQQKFQHRFVTKDRNIDRKIYHYFNENDTSGITVSDSGLVEWTSRENFYGHKSFMLYVSDGIEKDSLNIYIKVHPEINLTLSDTSFNIQPGNLFTAPFQPKPTYPFNQYTYSLIDGPENMHIDINGNITWTPIPSQVDYHRLTVKVEDATTHSNLDIVIYVNSPPIISSNPPSTTYLKEEENFSFRLGSYDANENAKLSWYLIQGPEGMWMDSTGVISWTPIALDFVDYTVELSDGFESVQFSGYIYINSIPVITSESPKEINFGDTLKYEILSKDKNKAFPFDIEKENNIQHILIDASKTAQIIKDNILKWVPSEDEIGEKKFFVAVSDGLARTKQEIIVYVNHIPAITSADSISIQLNKDMSYLVTAEDLNTENIVTFELLDNPDSIILSNDTLKWTPDSTNLGKTIVKIQATDGYKNSVSMQELIIFVYTLPEFINSAPTEAFVGVEYSFQPQVNFMHKDTLKNHIALIESTSENIILDDYGNINWKPADHETGIQQMTFKAIDQYGLSSTAIYTVGVKENPHTQQTKEIPSIEPKEKPSLPTPSAPLPAEEEIQPSSEE